MAQLDEGFLTFNRITELVEDPVKGKFDTAHLREAHRRIFQDLLHHGPGEFRPDAPAHIKNRVLEAHNASYHVYYAPRREIEPKLQRVLRELKGPEGFRGLSIDQFSERMAKLYGDLDYIHPFREGNSRTLRVFTAQLAKAAGRALDWGTTSADAVSRDRLYLARDREVLQRAFSGLDEARVMRATDRGEYEKLYFARETLGKLQQADSLAMIIRESVDRGRDLAGSTQP